MHHHHSSSTVDHILHVCVLSQYLGQFTEVPLVDVATDAVVGLLHVLANKSEGIGRGQQRKELVLLRLVVEDLGLGLSVEHKHTGLTFQCPFFFANLRFFFIEKTS